MKEKDILKRLVKNDALFRNIHVITKIMILFQRTKITWELILNSKI